MKRLVVSTLIAVTCGLSTGCVSAFASGEMDPDVTASVWEENGTECASVTLNGKELLSYKGVAAGRSAEDRAEDLAEKLQNILEGEKVDPEKLVPSKDGDQLVIRLDGANVIKFDTPETIEGSKAPASANEQSLKIVNAVRTALGANALPSAMAKVADCVTDGAPIKTGQGGFSGHASWYGGKFHGRRTSDGSRYDQDGFTAAHRTLPFGTKLLVMNRKTKATCVVEVNDRGPFVDGRVIDVSRGAARQLNMISSGVAIVDCMVIGTQ